MSPCNNPFITAMQKDAVSPMLYPHKSSSLLKVLSAVRENNSAWNESSAHFTIIAD